MGSIITNYQYLFVLKGRHSINSEYADVIHNTDHPEYGNEKYNRLYFGFVDVDSALLINQDGFVQRYSLYPRDGRYHIKIKPKPEAGQTYTIKVYMDGCCYEATQTIPEPVKFSHITETTEPRKDGPDGTVPILHFIKEDNSETNYVVFGTTVWSVLLSSTLNWDITFFSDEDITPGPYGIRAFKNFYSGPIADGENYGKGAYYFHWDLWEDDDDYAANPHKYDNAYIMQAASMTQDNYNFLKAINKFYNSDGGMFLSLPTNIPTNFTGPSNVHGQFFALNVLKIVAEPQKE